MRRRKSNRQEWNSSSIQRFKKGFHKDATIQQKLATVVINHLMISWGLNHTQRSLLLPLSKAELKLKLESFCIKKRFHLHSNTLNAIINHFVSELGLNDQSEYINHDIFARSLTKHLLQIFTHSLYHTFTHNTINSEPKALLNHYLDKLEKSGSISKNDVSILYNEADKARDSFTQDNLPELQKMLTHNRNRALAAVILMTTIPFFFPLLVMYKLFDEDTFYRQLITTGPVVVLFTLFLAKEIVISSIKFKKPNYTVESLPPLFLKHIQEKLNLAAKSLDQAFIEETSSTHSTQMRSRRPSAFRPYYHPTGSSKSQPKVSQTKEKIKTRPAFSISAPIQSDSAGQETGITWAVQYCNGPIKITFNPDEYHPNIFPMWSLNPTKTASVAGKYIFWDDTFYKPLFKSNPQAFEPFKLISTTTHVVNPENEQGIVDNHDGSFKVKCKKKEYSAYRLFFHEIAKSPATKTGEKDAVLYAAYEFKKTH